MGDTFSPPPMYPNPAPYDAPLGSDLDAIYEPGSIGRRLLAAIIDGIILVVAGAVLFALPVLAFAVAFAYPIILQRFLGGTFGKWSLSLQVHDLERKRASLGRITGRGLAILALQFGPAFIGALIGELINPDPLTTFTDETTGEEVNVHLAEVLAGVFILATLVAQIITVLARRDRRALHDLMAGTIVVHTERSLTAAPPAPPANKGW